MKSHCFVYELHMNKQNLWIVDMLEKSDENKFCHMYEAFSASPGRWGSWVSEISAWQAGSTLV